MEVKRSVWVRLELIEHLKEIDKDQNNIALFLIKRCNFAIIKLC